MLYSAVVYVFVYVFVYLIDYVMNICLSMCFDFLIVVFLNAGNFLTGKKDGLTGRKDPEFYTLSNEFIKAHHDSSGAWHKVRLSGAREEIDPYKNEHGFELIALRLGIPPLSR